MKKKIPYQLRRVRKKFILLLDECCGGRGSHHPYTLYMYKGWIWWIPKACNFSLAKVAMHNRMDPMINFWTKKWKEREERRRNETDA